MTTDSEKTAPPTPAEALTGFSVALTEFRAKANAYPALADRLFEDAGEWLDLLEYKLGPNLAADPCLVVAIAGGTNTGKSTVYNLLLHRDTSPVRMTAAATCRPVLAASARRAAEFSQGKLLSAFRARPLTDPAAVIDANSPKNALYIATNDRLPETFVLLDTPDVDSIDTANWEVADHIRAAGDVVVAVLTGEKYKDIRVVEFFRAARASGRVVLPLMNKANPANDFATARTQLAEFCQDTGSDASVQFAVAHDFSLGEDFTAEAIAPLAGTPPLFEYLQGLDVAAIKECVYRDTLRHFAHEAGDFLQGIQKAAAELRAAERAIEQLAETAAQKYDPKPGAQMGVLMHEFVQSKRGAIGKALGAASRGFLHVSSAGARAVGRRVFGRDILPAPPRHSEKERDRINAEELALQVRDTVRALYNECERLPDTAASLLRAPLDALDADLVQQAVLRDTVKAESISADFRRHAFEVMDLWWQEEKTQRMMVEAADAVLMVAPAALVLYTIPGTGIGEAAAAASTSFLEQVAVRALLFQFGGRIVKLIGPWQEEQRAALRAALLAHVTGPVLENLRTALAILEGDNFTAMKSNLAQSTAWKGSRHEPTS